MQWQAVCSRVPFVRRHNFRLVASLTADPDAALVDLDRERIAEADRGHGVIVDSVNVKVLEYAPVRSGSDAPMVCLKRMVSASLLTGPV